MSFDKFNLEAVIRLNPQLKSLRISHYNDYVSSEGIEIDSYLLKFIAKNLPNLETLSLSVNPADLLELREVVEFDNLKKLEYGTCYEDSAWIFTDESESQTYIRAKKLEVLKLFGFVEDYYTQYDFISPFAVTFTSIRELQIAHCCDFGIMHKNFSLLNSIDHLEAIYVFYGLEDDKENYYVISRECTPLPGEMEEVQVQIQQLK